MTVRTHYDAEVAKQREQIQILESQYALAQQQAAAYAALTPEARITTPEPTIDPSATGAALQRGEDYLASLETAQANQRLEIESGRLPEPRGPEIPQTPPLPGSTLQDAPLQPPPEAPGQDRRELIENAADALSANYDFIKNMDMKDLQTSIQVPDQPFVEQQKPMGMDDSLVVMGPIAVAVAAQAGLEKLAKSEFVADIKETFGRAADGVAQTVMDSTPQQPTPPEPITPEQAQRIEQAINEFHDNKSDILNGPDPKAQDLQQERSKVIDQQIQDAPEPSLDNKVDNAILDEIASKDQAADKQKQLDDLKEQHDQQLKAQAETLQKFKDSQADKSPEVQAKQDEMAEKLRADLVEKQQREMEAARDALERSEQAAREAEIRAQMLENQRDMLR